MENQVGKTKDVGFQYGIRKTIPVSNEKVWDFLLSENGLSIWFETQNGTTGLVRVFSPNSHIRLN